MTPLVHQTATDEVIAHEQLSKCISPPFLSVAQAAMDDFEKLVWD